MVYLTHWQIVPEWPGSEADWTERFDLSIVTRSLLGQRTTNSVAFYSTEPDTAGRCLSTPEGRCSPVSSCSKCLLALGFLADTAICSNYSYRRDSRAGIPFPSALGHQIGHRYRPAWTAAPKPSPP